MPRPQAPGFATTCALVIGAGLLGLLVSAAVLPLPRAHALPYLCAGFLTWGFLGHQLWSHRAEAVGGRLGPATAITLLRGWLVAVVGGHLLLPPLTGSAATVVALTYTTAAVLDNIDGRVARRTEHTSALGAWLDVRADALGLLVAPLVAIRAGRLPPWYALLSLAFPLMRAGLRYRIWRRLPVFLERLKPDPRARLFAGVQMGVVATALYPLLPTWFLWPAATLAMLPTLWLFAGEWRRATRE
jgi:CDP-diacylglycerol--glycerol-3-phosphate 3-phosphatidyltransferase